ncbi:uncharacterized protein MYCFIDRAFT_49459 [Pseudocercospora fijiensis CIRAD86]|uniref:Alpha/beta hydrolase fold-3 domain-containing protein n=1 Tax=Pseudocercospora fijiensis (strain CIRAD86) TaxID=383855 RepID=M2ZAH3_PSEFD|nr:uncharacterized protein MYCFIDRAFT_49459 [Pseudocercospora fijiensis CIRAD86]EME86810.1 hypothetical protein MYCFIDRAFT_49459 [Pseudocercospora fijiensis CIRAD86]
MGGDYAQSWKDWEAASGGRAILHGSPAEIRGMVDGLMQALTPMMPPFTEAVDVKEGDVDGIKYRIYTPKAKSGPFPTAIWTHEGGYMTGDLDSDHLICGLVSEHTNSAVVNIDYRLAPEFQWPTQLEDSMKVYKWAHANASSFGGDPNKFYTAGGSAGGALAFQIANQVVQDPELKDSIKGIVAMVPATTHWDSIPEKYKSKHKSYEENKEGTPIIDKKSMEIFFEHLGPKADPNDPNVFTILATDNHAKYPPTYLTSCEFDPLRDDAYIMEEALKEAGVPVKHDHYKGMPHYFWIIPAIPEGQEYVSNLLQGIAWVLAQSK